METAAARLNSSQPLEWLFKERDGGSNFQGLLIITARDYLQDQKASKASQEQVRGDNRRREAEFSGRNRTLD